MWAPVGSTGALGCGRRRGWTGWTLWTGWTGWTKCSLVRQETLTGNTRASSCRTSNPVHKVHHCPFCPSFRCRSQSSSNHWSDKMPLGAARNVNWQYKSLCLPKQFQSLPVVGAGETCPLSSVFQRGFSELAAEEFDEIIRRAETAQLGDFTDLFVACHQIVTDLL